MEYKVVWKEGLFLRPQHFQQNDRYYAYEMMTRTKELGSNVWGFFHLEIDQSYLRSGKIVLNSASGIMSDGTLFTINNISLEVSIEDIGKGVYLALPINVHNSDEVHFEYQKSRLTRSVGINLSDVVNSNADENGVTDLLVVKHNFKLLFEEDVDNQYVKIKVAEIGDVSESGIIQLEDDYIPTYLHFSASKSLIAKINELINIVTYRMEKLLEKLSDSNVQAAELGDYLMLQLLTKTKSRIHYYLSQDRIHPSLVYLELVSFIAELTVFMKKEKVLEQKYIYIHEQQGESFKQVFTDLSQMLSMVLEQKSQALLIEKRKYGIYVSQIADKSILNGASFIFAVKGDLEDEKLKKVLLSNLKMGSIETIRDLVNYHLSGFKLKALAVAPRQIPYKVNFLYFKVELEEEDKEKLARSGGFAFHLSNEIPNIEYTLWAIRND
jgi:type VI secretion system protein ImpJ